MHDEYFKCLMYMYLCTIYKHVHMYMYLCTIYKHVHMYMCARMCGCRSTYQEEHESATLFAFVFCDLGLRTPPPNLNSCRDLL